MMNMISLYSTKENNYLATSMGSTSLYTRRLIGWHLDRHMRADIELESLKKAEGRSKLSPRTIIHSDRGSQY